MLRWVHPGDKVGKSRFSSCNLNNNINYVGEFWLIANGFAAVGAPLRAVLAGGIKGAGIGAGRPWRRAQEGKDLGGVMSGSSDLGGVMSGSSDVVIIGAGLYGLRLPPILRKKGIEHRIVGDPMQFWSGAHAKRHAA